MGGIALCPAWVPCIHGLLPRMRILAPCLEAAVTQSWSVPWFLLPAPSSLLTKHQHCSREELLVLPSLLGAPSHRQWVPACPQTFPYPCPALSGP